MSLANCTYEFIQQNLDKACEIAKNCEFSYINFYELHYCTFNSHIYLSIPLFVLILIICFFLLGDTSGKYLSTALTILSDKCNMSQNLAAVTFLALGNGAPDVISSFVASDDEDGIEFSVGAFVGSSLLVVCLVLSSVVVVSGTVQVNKQLFVRDILFYLVALIILVVFSLKGNIQLWEAVALFLLYVM